MEKKDNITQKEEVEYRLLDYMRKKYSKSYKQKRTLKGK